MTQEYLNDDQIALQLAEVVRSYATEQDNVPFLSGDLRKSIIVELYGPGVAVISSNLPYARAVHDGRPQITIRPKKRTGALVFWKDSEKRGDPFPDGELFAEAVKAGELIVTKKVVQPARPANPFIKRAFVKLADNGAEFLRPQVKEATFKTIQEMLKPFKGIKFEET